MESTAFIVDPMRFTRKSKHLKSWKLTTLLQNGTEQIGCSCDVTDLYLRVSRLESRPGHRLS
jgi:hypothetical protein